MNTKLIIIPFLCFGSLISAPINAEEGEGSNTSGTSSTEIHAAEARQALETQGEIRTNAYWDEEEDESLTDDVVEERASFDPADDASPAELQADDEDMPVERRYREEITVEEFRPEE